MQGRLLLGDGLPPCLCRPLVRDHVPRVGDDILPHAYRPRSVNRGQQLKHILH
jgi:hypothetical protein